MFCPKCGKTLPFDAVECPSCGLPVGESRFEGSPYTSAQAHIRPGDDVRDLFKRSYTRTAYVRNAYTPTVSEEPEATAAVEDETDDLTTYRPAASKDAAADIDFAAEQPAGDVPGAEDAAGDVSEQPAAAAEDIAEDDDLKLEALDMSRFRARPIESMGQVGISADVTERMQSFENEEPPRRVRGFGRRRPVYDDFEEVSDAEEQVPEQEQYAEEGEYNPDMDDQSEVFDDIDEEYDEVRHSEFGIRQIVKVIGVVVIIAAMVVGGVQWMNYIRDKQSAAPIENVRETLYTDGVALIENHASTANVEQVITAYSTSGDLSSLQTQLTAFGAAVTALSPEDATENEQIFVQALQKIESNITNCIISDAIAVGSNDVNSAAESDERWKVVNNSIAMLKAAASATDLTAIINGEVVDIQEQAQATPTPEPAVNYNTLSKGDKSDEVVEMQTRLVELGYLNETPDGAFGNKTQTAVKIFQQVAGLPVTGIADNDTLTALYDEAAPAAGLTN